MAEMNVVIEVDGLQVLGDPSTVITGGEGFFLKERGFQGWFDGVGIKSLDAEIPNGPGDFDNPQYAQSRIVSIDGWYLFNDVEAAQYQRNRLSGLLRALPPGETTAVFTVFTGEAGSYEWGRAKLADKVVIDVDGNDPLYGEFQIQLKFPDPHRYGVTRDAVISDLSATLSHQGNVAAYPKVMVSGLLGDGFTLTSSLGGTYTYIFPVLSGQVVTVDMARGLAYVNGVPAYGGTSVADIMTVPPGVTAVISLDEGTVGATLTATVTDTSI